LWWDLENIFCLSWSRTMILSISASHIQLLVRWSLMNFLPGLAWNRDPPDLSIPSN
jgi:hypothetical protein